MNKKLHPTTIIIFAVFVIVCFNMVVGLEKSDAYWLYGYAETETQGAHTAYTTTETTSIHTETAETGCYSEDITSMESKESTESPATEVAAVSTTTETTEAVVKYLVTAESVTEAVTTTVETVEKPLRYILTGDEKRMISVVAWNADHTDDDSLACIIQTILNRVYETDKFPDAVESVLRQPKQFESCDMVLCDTYLYDCDRISAIIDSICDGYDPFDGELALYYSASYVPSSKIATNLLLIKIAGGSKFYGQN